MPQSENPLIKTPYGKKRWELVKEGLDVIEATPIFIAVAYLHSDPDDKKDDRGQPIIHRKTELLGPFSADEEADKALAAYVENVRHSGTHRSGYSHSFAPLRVERGVPQVYKLPRDEGGYHPYHVYYKAEAGEAFLIVSKSDGLWVPKAGDNGHGKYVHADQLKPGDEVSIPRREGREQIATVVAVAKKPLFWNDPK